MTTESMTWQEVCRELLRLDAEGVDEPWREFELCMPEQQAKWLSALGVDQLMSWVTTHPECVRLKPRTIRIGDREVPEPVREPLKDGDAFWIAGALPSGVPSKHTWRPEDIYFGWLRLGIVHRTREAAQQHIDALIAVSGGEP